MASFKLSWGMYINDYIDSSHVSLGDRIDSMHFFLPNNEGCCFQSRPSILDQGSSVQDKWDEKASADSC